MSGFQVGDVVVCVDDGPCRCCGASTTLRVGNMYRVLGPGPANIKTHSPTIRTAPPARFISAHPIDGANPDRFRKIRPASDEFISALRACKPERIGEPSNV